MNIINNYNIIRSGYKNSIKHTTNKHSSHNNYSNCSDSSKSISDFKSMIVRLHRMLKDKQIEACTLTSLTNEIHLTQLRTSNDISNYINNFGVVMIYIRTKTDEFAVDVSNYISHNFININGYIALELNTYNDNYLMNMYSIYG